MLPMAVANLKVLQIPNSPGGAFAIHSLYGGYWVAWWTTAGAYSPFNPEAQNLNSIHSIPVVNVHLDPLKLVG